MKALLLSLVTSAALLISTGSADARPVRHTNHATRYVNHGGRNYSNHRYSYNRGNFYGNRYGNYGNGYGNLYGNGYGNYGNLSRGILRFPSLNSSPYSGGFYPYGVPYGGYYGWGW